jgi:deoxyribodipyrimidine photo-lyase
VVAQRWIEPFARERDSRVRQALGPRFELLGGETLLTPGALRTGSGAPYSVFTPFARAFRERAVIGRPLPAPRALPPVPGDVRVEEAGIPACEELGIKRNPALLPGGEEAARARLRRFLRDAASAYPAMRQRMDVAGTSRLSADLHFGTISAREVWNTVEGSPAFHDEILWREFAHSTLHDRPELLEHPFRREFEGFPWTNDEEPWRAWASGTTGYPVVDASARQLLDEGFVHNRARMIAASFLAKHLLIDFRRGEAHYLRYLTDGDWANNDLGWQWSAGCGCDAQPWFRIFNPVTQGENFDPAGTYVRRWVPELRRMPANFIHRPWEAPDQVLQEAGVRLGEDYPRPLIDHRLARERFLAVAGSHLGSAPRKRGTSSARAAGPRGSSAASSARRTR